MQYESVSYKQVKINDTFWAPFMERVRLSVIPYQWEALNDRIEGAAPSFCIRNFKIAAQVTHPQLDYDVDSSLGHGGYKWQDSDAAKWIEAAAYTLIWHPDPELEKTVDEVIDIICNAQQSDGYLNTYYIITGLDKRFTNLRDNHELYCFGHFLEAALAWYEATGKRKFLDVMIRYADCVNRLFGPEEGKLQGYPGHEIAEMALVWLYRVTGDVKHLKLAQYFIDQRGQPPLYFAEEATRDGKGPPWEGSYFGLQYYQAGRPVRDQHIAEGHAVRATYLYSAMADIARLTGDEPLLEACNSIWNNIVNRQIYITGGIGQCAYGESFTFDYDLPNDMAYAETCASIGLAFFAKRMASIVVSGTYGDVLEKALYNGIISGMSLDGTEFFYVNPLEVHPESCLKAQPYRHVKTRRQKWFGCACCPPNLARIIASLGSYIHTTGDAAVYTHLFIGSESVIKINGKELLLTITTKYPWDSNVNISFAVKSPVRFVYGFRIPGWCSYFSVKLNGNNVGFTVNDGFALLDRQWQEGDSLEIMFDMPVQFIQANPKVRANSGKVSVMRGPVVYCMEETDNGPGLHNVRCGQPRDIDFQYESDLLEGVVTVSFTGKKESDWDGDSLYRNLQDTALDEVPLRWIPYYAWANREPGEMIVWIKRQYHE